ncbi:YopX family protein [Cytobacillus kochii]|nr:YopX family protein [Cytobacillus kochii]
MREIKFRAWDKSRKEMEYINNMYWFEENGVDDINNNVFLDFMQYTGIKDKNGKEIYEGDAVSTDLSRPYLIVVFRNGAFMYQCHHNNQDYYDHMEPAFSDEVESTKFHEVIGNIYENPELINS